MQELGAELMLLCSNVQADALGDRERCSATSPSSPSAPALAGCGSATKRWPGAAT